MAVLINNPDFLIDPEYDVVLTLDYDEDRNAIGGVFGATPVYYQKSLDDPLTYEDSFTIYATVKFASLINGLPGIGGIGSSGEWFKVCFSGFGTPGYINAVQVRMKDGLAEVTSSLTSLSIAVDDNTYFRLRIDYQLQSSVATTRVRLWDVTAETTYVDYTSNVSAEFSLDSFGLYGADAVVGVDEESEAYFTALILEDDIPLTGLTISYEEVVDELGALATQQSNILNTVRRRKMIERWIEIEKAKILEGMDLTETQLLVQENATAAQLVQRQIMFKDALLFRVVMRILRTVESQRVEWTEPSFAKLIDDYRREATELILHLMWLYHPMTRGETVSVTAMSRLTDDLQGSGFSLRPIDEDD